MVAGSLVTMGTLGDRLGHRRILLVGGVLLQYFWWGRCSCSPFRPWPCCWSPALS
ncbi:hypothetical protein [Nonomuraea sp. NPDC049028]|uniref:hypothetical protein n=1 Tax=Nonomuraea sp. NPDC049028 TaxID=3364348 RepID=UPI003722EE54